MNFKDNITLENDRVLLTPLEEKDYDILLPFSLNEPILWEYSLLPANGESNLKSYLNAALEGRKASHSYPFLVFDKLKGEVAGSTRFYDYQEKHNTIQIGYTWYGKKFQRTGLNQNCKLLLLEFAFEKLKLDRVEFRADNNNKASIKAMKSIGCVEEGVLRSNCASPTGRRDSIILSILKSEWPQVKQNLQTKIK